MRRGRGPEFVRQLWRSPAYALLVVVTLGLSLFTLATMTSVVDAVLLRPLPYRSPDRIVALWETAPRTGAARFRFSVANFVDVSAQREDFERAALFRADSARLLSGGEPQQLFGASVEPDYFAILGIQPQLGRTFVASDSRPSAARVVILSHSLFARRFGSDPAILGRAIRLDDEPVTVVGVLPPGLYPSRPLTHGGINFLPELQQYWVPLVLDADWQTNRRTHVFGGLARLRSGVSAERAERDLKPLAKRLAAKFPATNRGVAFRVAPITDEFVGSSRRLLWVMLGAAALVVGLATANLGGVAVSRAVARSFETAVRVSLGASRGRLLRAACTEALALAAVGTLVGLLFSGLLRPLLSALDLEIPRLAESRVNSLVVLVTFGVAALSAIAVGLAQIHGAAASRPEEALRRGGFGSGGSSAPQRRLHRALVVLQVGLSVVLVCMAGLFARSWLALQRVDPGFAPSGVLVADLELPASSYGSWDRIVAFQRTLLSRLSERHGVLGAAVAYDPPLSSSWSDTYRLIDGGRAEDSSGTISGQLNVVSPRYFETVGIPLLRGRSLTDRDDREHPGAVLVSESFARVHFPDGDALGRRLRALTPSRVWSKPPAAKSEFTIVGVVGDVHNRGLEDPIGPSVYFCNGQFPQATMTVLVRLSSRPTVAFAAELREIVRQLDATLPTQHVSTLPQMMDRELAQPRFALGLAGILGGGALLLASLGIYGLLSLLIRTRTREFAIRLAMGAQPVQVAGQVLSETARLTALGILLGIVGALAGAHGLRSLLFGVTTDDPLVLCATAAVLFATAALAALGPVRRAARVEPALALRAP
jgi:putative ABC transport system permease protein